MTTDDTHAPDRAPDNDGRPPNQRLIRLGKAFVDFCEGDLSEGQIVQMTGLDRLKVREIDALFNQAVGLLDEALAEAAEAPVAPAEPITGSGARLVYVALHYTTVEGIGATKEEARTVAVDRRRYFRKQRREAGCVGVNDEREAKDNDETWSAELTFVTLSGAVENLRLFVEGNEDLSMARPVCPRDLWSDGDLAEVKP